MFGTALSAVRRAGLPAALLALAVACDFREGPRLRTVPEGTGFTTTVDAAHTPLPKRRRISQVAYSPGPFAVTPELMVTITRYEGQAARSEVDEAVASEAIRRSKFQTFGPVEEIGIDGRAGWGWLTTWSSGSISTKVYSAVVPYETETYGIEIFGSKGKWTDPDVLRAVARDFTIAGHERRDGFVLMAGGLSLGLVTFVLWRMRAADRPV